MFFLERRSLLQLQNKLYLFSVFLIVPSWTLTFNMFPEACRVWDLTPDSFWGFLRLLHNLTLGWTSKDIHSLHALNGFHLLIIFLCFQTIVWTYFLWPFPNWYGFFSKIIADVFLPLHCFVIHLNILNKQTAKRSAFTGVYLI